MPCQKRQWEFRFRKGHPMMYRREEYVQTIYYRTMAGRGRNAAYGSISGKKKRKNRPACVLSFGPERTLRRTVLRALAMAVTTLLISAAILFAVRPLPVMVSAAPNQETGLSSTAVDIASMYREASETLLPAEEPVPTDPGVPVVILDPGHGGEDEGCTAGGILEKDINLSIANLVKLRLEALGFQVLMTRDTDTYLSKEDRVMFANQSGADLFVSIHQNSSEDPTISGLEVWYDEDGIRDSGRLARLLEQQTLLQTGAVKRELRGDAGFHVTGQTMMPACLTECGFLTNDAERTALTSVEYQERIADGITQGIDLYFHPKTMYLTFDDGPSPENTVRILDILQARNIKATFFLVGENVRRYPDIVQRIVADGHTIGIHCDNHDYAKLYASADSYLADFEAAHQTLLDLTGIDVKLFRFPGGSVNDFNAGVRDEIIREMTARGYIYYDWNASLEDAVESSDPAQLVANGVSTTLGRQKVIMLAHDVKSDTALCLDTLLDSLPEYRMLPLNEAVEPIRFH